jgi:hypothetical protein
VESDSEEAGKPIMNGGLNWILNLDNLKREPSFGIRIENQRKAGRI